MRRTSWFTVILLPLVGLFTVSCFDTGGTGGGESDGGTVVKLDGYSGADGRHSGSDADRNNSETGGSSDSEQFDKWADSDKDGKLDRFDNCPKTKNPDQKDKDQDGVGDACDNMKDCANASQKKKVCEDGYNVNRDRDKDGVRDIDDNCLETANANQKDTDGDGIGDACETPASEKLGSGTDSDGDGLSDKEEMKAGTDPNNPDSDGDGSLDGSEVIVGTNPGSGDKACGEEEHTADLETKPIDIIVVIDTSGSMYQEIAGVENNINQNFGQILNMAGIDYRVVMLARKGATQYEVCVKPPLASASCGNTSKFKHLNVNVYSHDSLEHVINEYPNYKQYLRSKSFKVFLEITDDDCSYKSHRSNATGQAAKNLASAFEQDLFGLSQTHFGTKSNRNYMWHAITGLKAKSTPSDPYKPNEAIVPQTQRCSGGVDSGEAYQWLAKWTGGLRYPVCHTQTYNAVFQKIATGIVKQAKIGCQLSLPMVGSGKTVDNDKIALQWKPKGASKTTLLTKVHDKANCGKNNFYMEKGKIKLCSSICTTVKNTKDGKMTVLTGCENCQSSEEVCDYKDNNCNGEVDEKCEGCGKEVCDGMDNNCNGMIDEGCPDCGIQGKMCSKD